MNSSPILLRFIVLFTCMVCVQSAARDSDGRLYLIQTPNNGMPAITVPGTTFTALITEKAELSLTENGEAYPLTAVWKRLPSGLQKAHCQLPKNVPPGTYALKADTEKLQDTNEHAVYVFDTIPEEYHIAHITDTHIGTQRHPRKDTAIIKDVINAVNASGATLALFTGDLTENGHEEQFQQFLSLLETCTMPTFVVAGNHDRQARHYELFFCKQTYAFQFGKDAYLGYDTKDYLIADDAREQNGLLYLYRRKIRSARWSIGFTHRYDLTMGIRAQLTLFVDDPLDYVLYGHYHRETDDQDGIPWGKTKIIMTPAAINGQFRIVTVDPNGLHPQETIQAASITLDSKTAPPTDNKQSNPAQ